MDNMQQDGMQQGGTQQDGMQKFMHNAFWLKDRISATFKVLHKVSNAKEVLRSEELPPPFPTLATIIPLLGPQVDFLNRLIEGMDVHLNFFISDDSPTSIYLFGPDKVDPRTGNAEARVVSFLHIEGNGAAQPGLIPRIVNQINQYLQSQKDQSGRQGPTVATSPSPDLADDETQVSISSSAPTYFCGAAQVTNLLSQGCPLTPPIPVPGDAVCPSTSGRWPFSLPKLPHDLQSVTGDGVTVFVLDTLPKLGQIKRAAEGAEENNLLLLDVANNVTFTYPEMLDGLDDPGPLQAGTGKDVHGRLVGFRMPDHGLFVAGIIRDLAPDANVECIRVLNDLCSGSAQTLTDALNGIAKRMLPINPDTGQAGNLYNTHEKKSRPVVINLSLVIPDDNEVLKQVKNAGIDPSSFSLDMAREGLLTAIQSLVNLGAVFVASAGNEGDQRFDPMNNLRPNALYPAAFAYNGLNPHRERMIPVGAVNKDGNVTTYSCYPGLNGFATFGGDVPQKDDIKDGHGTDMTTVDVSKIDAPIGLYTSLYYPALSIDDPQFRYPAPNANGWAYWVGTSFATPVVSAVAARALELNLRNPPAVQAIGLTPKPIVISAATERIQWTNLDTSAAGANTTVNPSAKAEGLMILAVQCKPDVDEEEDEEDSGEEEVNTTETVGILEGANVIEVIEVTETDIVYRND